MKGPVVVIDAANGVGRGIVQAALAAGRSVIAVSQDARELARLRALAAAESHAPDHEAATLYTVAGSIADEAACAALATALRDLDRPIAGIVIANCGDPTRGRVLDQPAQVLQRRLEGELLPQLAAAQHLLPLLAQAGRNGSYVVLGGPGSEQPWAGYGYRSVAAAATTMLVRVLHNEARALGVRVQMLAVTRPVRTEENQDCACEGWPNAMAIGAQALALIDQADPRQAANAIVRMAWRGLEPAAAELPEPLASAVLEQSWEPLAPGLRRREDRRK